MLLLRLFLLAYLNSMQNKKTALETIATIPVVNIIALSGYGVYKLVSYFTTSIIKIITQKKP